MTSQIFISLDECFPASTKHVWMDTLLIKVYAWHHHNSLFNFRTQKKMDTVKRASVDFLFPQLKLDNEYEPVIIIITGSTIARHMQSKFSQWSDEVNKLHT